jgi:hypothetical protein
MIYENSDEIVAVGSREIYTIDFSGGILAFRGPGNEGESLSTLMPKIAKRKFVIRS